MQHTRCGYDKVSGTTLLQAFLYTYNLLRGVTFKVLPLGSHELSPLMPPLLNIFWNSCCGIAFGVITFFGCFQYPENFVPLWQILHLETAQSYSEPNQGNGVCVLFQKSIFKPETD
jgi:hypothetical protein